jgi:hypothetical protein
VVEALLIEGAATDVDRPEYGVSRPPATTPTSRRTPCPH